MTDTHSSLPHLTPQYTFMNRAEAAAQIPRTPWKGLRHSRHSTRTNITLNAARDTDKQRDKTDTAVV